MSKLVYGLRNTNTVTDIREAPLGIRAVWNRANDLGINMLRVRSTEDRNEITEGDTFLGFHQDRVSIYQQHSNPAKSLHFVRPTPLGETNKGMQILEVAENIDVMDTLNVIGEYQWFTSDISTVSEPNFVERFFVSVRNMFA